MGGWMGGVVDGDGKYFPRLQRLRIADSQNTAELTTGGRGPSRRDLPCLRGFIQSSQSPVRAKSRER